MNTILRTTLLFAGMAWVAPFAAATDADVLRERVERAVLEWMEGHPDALAGEPDSLSLSFSVPEQRIADAGIVFDGTWDPSAENDGLRIITLRPGGAGSRMGLKEGDRIVAVNGVDLRHLGETQDGRARAAEALSRLVAGHGPDEPLQIEVKRGGQQISLSGPIDGRYLPAIHFALGQAAVAAADSEIGGAAASTRGCGEISSFATPPRARDLFPVIVTGIDGEEWFGTNRSSWRVPAGTYKVRVVELISDPRLRVSSAQRGYSKVMEITVEPDRTYDLAARFNVDQRFRGPQGAYWDPEVWRSEPKACRRVDYEPKRGGR
ncbi:MAG TPA: PDZ domain-containing protein [Xanthomonadaceae bacterium]|nr:PDZ domain-containing protein [Xanthomonadaceae bacterium]